MNSANELSKMSAIIRGIKEEDDIVENMEKKGQQQVIRDTMVARKMWPSKEHFEQLGFIFEDIPGDDVLCYATLPKGWSIKETDHSMWNDIIDENGMIRVEMLYKDSFYDRKARMNLICRYRICSRYLYTNDYSTREIYFGNDIEKIFVAGQATISKNASEEEANNYDNQVEKLTDIAKQYADENYPDWENVHAYWENEKENSEEAPKQIVKK